MIKFRAFGALELSGTDGGEHRQVLTQSKRVALLSYLVAAQPPRFHRRDVLLGLFWPELSQDRARAALRQALHGLRQALGPEAIMGRGDEEVKVSDRALWSDVRTFDRAVAEQDYETALALYRGDLLEGFYLTGAPEFERWLEEARSRRRRLASQAARVLARRRRDSGTPADAVPLAHQALALGGDEEALRELITLLDTLGDRASALEAYDTFAKRLAADFGVEPSGETQDLVAAVGARVVRPGPARPSVQPHADAAMVSAPAVEMPFAGQPRAHRWLWPGLTVLATVIVMAAGARLGLSRSSLDSHRLLVAPFENRTGDPGLTQLGLMASDWVARGLAETGLLEVANPLIVGTDLGTDPRPASAPEWSGMSARSLPQLSAAAGAGTIVSGAFYRQGDTLRFEAAITDVNHRRLLASIGAVSGPADDPRQAIMALRQAIAGRLAGLVDPRIGEWSGLSSFPPSLEAYRAFTEGQEKLNRLEARSSLVDFTRAAGMDSSFTLPLIEAVHAEIWLGDCRSADSLIGLLTRPGRTLAPLDRFMLKRQAAICRGDVEEQYRTSLAMARLLPSSESLALGVGRDALLLNRPAQARRILERLHPDRGALATIPYYYLFLGIALHQLGDYDRELAEARRARRQYPDNLAAIRYELFPLAALGRLEAIDSLLAEAVVLPAHPLRSPDELMRDAALELRAHGYPAASSRILDRALDWLATRPNGEPDTETGRLARLKTLYAAEKWREAQSLAETLVNEHPDSAYYQGMIGVLAAQRGDHLVAGRADSSLSRLRQPGTEGQVTYWRACIAARSGERDRAVALLIQARDQARRHAAEYFMMLHADPSLAGLRGYPAFDEFLRPKG